MPIEFTCPQCRHRLRTPDDSAGKQSRCPQCGHIAAIPTPGDFGANGEELPPSAAVIPLDNRPANTIWQKSENPFADLTRPVASNPYAAPATASLDVPPNRNATILPGAMLIAVAATSMMFLALAIFAGVMAVIDEGLEYDDLLAFIFLGVTLAVQFLILWGGVNMVRRRGYAMAMAGAIAATVPLSLCWCLHLPLGAWSLAVLLKQGMRAVFSASEAR